MELVRRGASDEELEVSLRPCERLEEADGVADNGKESSHGPYIQLHKH